MFPNTARDKLQVLPLYKTFRSNTIISPLKNKRLSLPNHCSVPKRVTPQLMLDVMHPYQSCSPSRPTIKSKEKLHIVLPPLCGYTERVAAPTQAKPFAASILKEKLKAFYHAKQGCITPGLSTKDGLNIQGMFRTVDRVQPLAVCSHAVPEKPRKPFKKSAYKPLPLRRKGRGHEWRPGPWDCIEVMYNNNNNSDTE